MKDCGTMSDTYCVIPFIHLESRADGFIAPCCLSQEFYRKESGQFFNLSRDTLTDVWESSAIQELRDSLLRGEKPSACNVCWQEESCGKQSKRQRENLRWEKTEVPNFKFADLKLGNTCNLKCRTCTISSSSNWITETIETGNEQLLKNYSEQDPDGNYRKILQWPLYNKNFWSDFEKFLPNIELFEVYGGEPLLNKQHFSILQKSIDLGYSVNQSIHYNTNGTIYPDFAIENIWKHFKRVDLMLSIDGVGEQFEYLRHPAKWDVVYANILKYKEHFSTDDLQICYTISSLNVYYIPEFLEFAESLGLQVYLNLVHVPDEFSAQYLPREIKDQIITKLSNHLDKHSEIESVISFLAMDSENKYIEFMRKVNVHDEYRKENYFETFSEFGQILKQYRMSNQV